MQQTLCSALVKSPRLLKTQLLRRSFVSKSKVIGRQSTRHFVSGTPQAHGFLAGASAVIYNDSNRLVVTKAEEAIPVSLEPLLRLSKGQSRWTLLKRKVLIALRMFARLVKLSFALAPIALLYPIQSMLRKDKDVDAHEFVLRAAAEAEPSGLFLWYLNMCLASVEWSGAAVIKLMQWAGSRPDLFGHEFCSIFSRLQDNTSPHAWKHTSAKMEEAFGKDWGNRIELKELLGSGCIGQVYKGILLDTKEEVAVKIMHPNVRQDIDTDLDLMRLAAYLGSKLGKVKFLNLQGAVEEFAGMLKLQLDLRTEAENLDRFNVNFKDDKDVVFPKLIPGFRTTKDVLVESFCAGIPVLQYARLNHDDQETLTKLCVVGIRAVCKMIFFDNFLHGDLHPGNVFVNPTTKKFVLLDVGIVKEYSVVEHQLIINVLTAFIRKDGRRAGRLMIDDSNRRLAGQDTAKDEELYIDKIEALTIKASDKDYFMEHLGTYLSYIFEAAAKHHVLMNQSFVSAALAIKVQEGLALALDPGVQIWQVANPIILKSETQRQFHGFVKHAKEMTLEKVSELSKMLGLRRK